MGTALQPYQSVAPAGRPKRSPMSSDDPYSYVPEAQSYLQTAVEGYGEQLRPGLLKEIGGTLGGLNAIGGLRSGGVPVALGDISTKYAQQIGAYAKEASGEGLQYGLEARKQAFAEQEAKRRRKAALLGAIGTALGAGIGFAVAGPAGAAVGSNLAGHVGDFGPGSGGGGGPGSPGPGDTFLP